MVDALDQNEIDALLSAVEEQDDTPSMGGGGSAMGIGQGGEVRPYDFKRPERVSKDQMRSLETLHEAFARSMGALLSGFLRTMMQVKVVSIEQLTFSEFTHALPNPTCFNLVSCEPLEGRICLEISPLIVYPVIDRLLGGGSADVFLPQRPLTVIEERLVGQILDRAMAALKEAWGDVVDAEFKVTEKESNPALVQIVPPNEVVVVVGFELQLGERAGTMALCIPYAVIEPVMQKLGTTGWASYKKHNESPELRENLADRLAAARVGVAGVLARTTLTVGDLAELQVGDVITTDKSANSPLSLTVGGRPKFLGQLGQHRGSRAFKVSRATTPADRD